LHVNWIIGFGHIAVWTHGGRQNERKEWMEGMQDGGNTRRSKSCVKNVSV